MGSTMPYYINNAFFNWWWIKPPPPPLDNKDMEKSLNN